MYVASINKTLLVCLSTLFFSACDATFSISRSIQFEGSLSAECVELSATTIGLEAEQSNDINNRPIEEYFSFNIRREGTPAISANWISLEPQILSLDFSEIGSSSREVQQDVCDLMSDYTDSFVAQCTTGADSVVVEDTFDNTSCDTAG